MTNRDNAAKGDFNCCYRFGDVIRRVYTDSEDGNKQKTEYWVCVRPAFGPEGKGDSHWISLSPLPKKHIWEKEDSKNRVHRLPTGIGVSEKHMQNLAEMLYAMFNSESWRDNVLDYPAPTLFKDGQPKVAIFNDLELTDDETFFTSTEYPHNNSYGYVWGFAIRKDLEESCFISMVDKQRNSCSLRKFLAFKYSTGGKKDIE